MGFREAYPKRSGEEGWADAERLWEANLTAGVSASDMLAGAKRYALWCEATGKSGTQYVKGASNWLDPSKERWEEPYHIPESTKARDANGVPDSFGGAAWVPILSDREIAAAAEASGVVRESD